MTVVEKKVVARECRFVTFCPAPDSRSDDLHVVKEILHYEDNTTQPNVRLIKNYKRPYWVTKKGFRNHQDKKEWEDLSKVTDHKCRQSDLTASVAASMEMPWIATDDRKVKRLPYVYGTDINSCAVIKQSYQERFPNTITPFISAPFDTETDVVNGTGEILMSTLVCGSKIITSVTKAFVAGHSDVINKLHVLMDKYLGKVVKERNLEWEIKIVDTAAQTAIECINKAHVWKPDFISIWNIDFDIPKVTDALTKEGYDPKDIFSDPSVPVEHRFFKYRQGPKQKVKADGSVSPIKPSAQWHTVYTPSSFYFIDAMCSYKQIRVGQQEEQSYALDAILAKHFPDRPEVRKLKFEATDGITGLEWHQIMQTDHQLEYIVYNVFDCIAMQLLDEETSDLSLSLPLFAGCSSFDNFASQPRKLVDELHYECLANGKVIGTTCDKLKTPMDELSISPKGWIK